MVVTRFLFSTYVFLYLVQNSFAQMMEQGKTKVKTVINLYHQNGNDGKQVFDNSGREEANVFEPMVFVEHQITESTNIFGNFTADLWTAASDTKLDGRTGASGDGRKGQSRFAGYLGVKQEIPHWKYGAKFGVSTEYDYKSINGSVNLARSFAQDNFTLGLSAQYYLDTVDLFLDLSPASTAGITQDLKRKIFATNLSASQILTRKDIVEFALTYAHASGHLESTASSVLVSGVREVEDLPSTRNRYAISGKWVHGFGESTALHTSYRYYRDDWKLQAHTLKLSLLRDFNEESDFVEFFLRGHNQSKVDFYADYFSGIERHRTSDSDLANFTSVEGGTFLSFNYEDKKLWVINLEDINWNHSIVYGVRSNGLRYGYYQNSLGLSF